MKQYTDNLYDDDLTVETDDYEYDDSYSRDGVDLFEFSTDDESPISYLKSLILSIDWEITDEVLLAFNDELEALRSLWAGESINLIYIQALEKLSKYIYYKKADSHPNAIKLLLTLYYNLEKIVSSGDMSDKQKKMILLEDVKRFEGLKRQISQTAHDLDAPESGTDLGQLKEPAASGGIQSVAKTLPGEELLLNLKAIVLGIDWEITDQDLNRLRQEVVRLEELFAESKPKLILLQGIGTLGAYIKLKKSDAHADAFTLLHKLYASLEEIVKTPMSLEEEKSVLFPAVELFNAFKALVGHTITEKTVNRQDDIEDDEELPAVTDEVAPAFSDISSDETRGFQADEEARKLGLAQDENVGAHVDDFFAEDEPIELDEFPAVNAAEGLGVEEGGHFGGESMEISSPVAEDIALQGVDVEEEDDSQGTAVDDIVPALSGALEGADEIAAPSSDDQGPAAHVDDRENEVQVPHPGGEHVGVDAESAAVSTAGGGSGLGDIPDRDAALLGVEVETEADDDSAEDSLPTLDGELAPALAENDEISFYNTESLENLTEEAGIEEEILQNIEGLFDAAEEASPSAPLNLDAAAAVPSPAMGESAPEEVEAMSQADAPAEKEALDIDRHIDSFFDIDETVDEDEYIFVETSREATATVPASVQSLPAEDLDEEEVVFELVVEEQAYDAKATLSAFEGETAEMLVSLRFSARSLKQKFDNKILMNIMEQLSFLRQKGAAKPLELIFVQLLSTVIQHIDKYRQSAAAESYDLLNSLCDTLEKAQGADSYDGQQLLLEATTKVLRWQQDLLEQQS